MFVLLYRGQISPAVENVKVSVIAPSEAAVVNKMAAAVSHTDASGKFRLGPLPQETQESGQYRVEAVKEGYVFEQVRLFTAYIVKVENDHPRKFYCNNSFS